MVDSRFFQHTGPISLADAAALTGATLSGGPGAKPDGAKRLSGVAPLEAAGPDDFSFLDNIKYLGAFSASKAGACFVRGKFAGRAPAGMALLETEEPHYAYAVLANHLYPEPAVQAGISPLAQIDSGAHIGEGARIDAAAHIHAGARIGARCWIGSGTVIGAHVEIGDDCRIGPCCTVTHAVIGVRTVLHRGVHIGTDGFGYAGGKAGLIKVPQLGRVLIGSDVEIGSGSCVDRGAGPDTVIGDFTKIDNLVQIGHNTRIGRFVLIAGQAGVAGSTVVGDGVMVGGQVGVGGHISIGAGAKLAAQSGIMTDIPAGVTHGGTPSVPIRDWHRQTVALHHLAKRMETPHE